MGRTSRKKQAQVKAAPVQEQVHQPWIQLRTGMVIIGVVGLAFGAFLAYQVQPASWKETVLWGLGGAGAVWLAFGVSLLINIITRGTSFLHGNK